jgi:hypothetical protein
MESSEISSYHQVIKDITLEKKTLHDVINQQDTLPLPSSKSKSHESQLYQRSSLQLS